MVGEEDGLGCLDDDDSLFALVIDRVRLRKVRVAKGKKGTWRHTFIPYRLLSSALTATYRTPATWKPSDCTFLGSLVSL